MPTLCLCLITELLDKGRTIYARIFLDLIDRYEDHDGTSCKKDSTFKSADRDRKSFVVHHSLLLGFLEGVPVDHFFRLCL
jgi:hypothetical protein